MGFLPKNKRAFILAMIALCIIVISFAYFHYKNINESKDPRVKSARLLYEKYNEYAVNNDFNNIFSLLDSVEFIYTQYPHYKESFEVGVLYNNRAAAYLTMALHNIHDGNTTVLTKDSLLNLSEVNVKKSISIYEDWLEGTANLEGKELRNYIKKDFWDGLNNFSEKDKEKFLNHRVNELETAKYETERRLSVSYTNLGIIYRHRENYEQAILYYQKALKLWEQNLSAENNLNILLGKPLKKRNLIQKLFPPKREK